jgi:hypothetical protein
MKPTKKQKLRKKEARRRAGEDRKYDVLDRLLNLYGIKSLFCPLDWLSKTELVTGIGPGLEVEIVEACRGDIQLLELKSAFERIIKARRRVSVDGRAVEISLDDLFRGRAFLRDLIEQIRAHLNARRHEIESSLLARLEETVRKASQFEQDYADSVLSALGCQLNDLVDEHLRIGEHLVWFKIERNTKYTSRRAYRLILGRKQQKPFILPISEGRKAFPCERTSGCTGPRQVKWKPCELGIGVLERELPVYVGKHAIDRLRERIPMPPKYHAALHNMLYESLDTPRLLPTESAGEFLVEAGRPERKVGYFRVLVSDQFVFVETFLFLTMQGTPEARCLRQKLGLTRTDIERFKLDDYYTLTHSDLSEDPELRHALAECGCDHLIHLRDEPDRLSWLTPHGDALRRQLGLLPRPAPAECHGSNTSRQIEVGEMSEFHRQLLKRSQGWIV